jgi:hypothetical protein
VIGREWLAADWTCGRASICRALRIERTEPTAPYATFPFTVLETDGGEHRWIAGAVGIWSPFTSSDWSADHVREVILWNPRTGELRLLGDDLAGATAILPDRPDARLTVYADGFSFFRAWADRRAEQYQRMRLAIEHHRVTQAEPTDSGLPGILAIGDVATIDWSDIGAAVLVAGPGVDPKALNRGVIRSARLPRVESLAA